MSKKLYSIVIPLYNEEKVIVETYIRLTNILEHIEGDYELVFVNDGSKDNTEVLAKEICVSDERVKLINLSRNFGHQIAITAGMDHAKGDAVIIIDADLQDPPELIPEMIEKYLEGYDAVYAIREERKGETFFKKATAKLFYRIMKYMTDIDIPIDVGDFRLISREVCNELKKIREKNRYVRGLVSWVGFKQIGIKYTRDERFGGETKYSLKKMIKLSVDGITSFSARPLKLATYLGFWMSFLGFLYGCYAIISKFLFNNIESGWASIVVIMLTISGIQLIMLGIAGEYVTRIYDETKNRPLYVVGSIVEKQNNTVK